MLQSHLMAGSCTVQSTRIKRAPFASREAGLAIPAGDESPGAMKQRIAELLLTAEFSAAIGNFLDPHQVCEAAAAWLNDAVGWQLLSVNSHGEQFGTVLNGKRNRGQRLSKKCQMDASAPLQVAGALNRLCDVEEITTLSLPDGSGTLSFLRKSLEVSQYSDEFKDGVVGNLARALAAARECERLKNLSMRDHLTGLYNRRVFEAMLEVEARKRSTKPFSLLLIDLDNFKIINDTYGHGAGDQVLVTVAKMLRLGFRKSDVVSRYGGEEFAVLLPETSQDAAWLVAERFRNNIASLSIRIRKEKILPTVSVGIATVMYRSGIEVADVIEEADRVLYKAKANGKNRVCASLLGEQDGYP